MSITPQCKAPFYFIQGKIKKHKQESKNVQMQEENTMIGKIKLLATEIKHFEK